MENLKYTFNQVNDWIKIADQKALILGSFNAIGFIYQLVNLDKFQSADPCTASLFGFSILVSLIAIVFWLRIIYPRLDNKTKKSKIYFQHVANAYENDTDTGIEDLLKANDEDFMRDLASQIVINSIIAKKKYSNIQKYIWVFGVQILLISLLVYRLS